jgi:hypothetical protein
MLKIRKKEKSFYNGQEMFTKCVSCEDNIGTMEIVVKGDKFAGVDQKLPVCKECLTGLSQ